MDVEVVGELGRFWPCWNGLVSDCVEGLGNESDVLELEKLLRRLARLMSLRTPDGLRVCGDDNSAPLTGEMGVLKLSLRGGGAMSVVEVESLVV